MFDTLFAKNSALSALGAKITPGKVYTYDGKAEELETFEGLVPGVTYALIATDAPSLTELTKAVGTFADGSKLEFSKEELRIEVTDAGEVAYATLNGMTMPLIIAGAGKMYVYSVEGVGYGSRVEFAETVHPIDPKFLPEGLGGGMPVVKLTTVLGEEAATFTPEETAALMAVMETGMPCVVRLKLGYGDMISDYAGVFNFSSFDLGGHKVKVLVSVTDGTNRIQFTFDGESLTGAVFGQE